MYVCTNGTTTLASSIEEKNLFMKVNQYFTDVNIVDVCFSHKTVSVAFSRNKQEPVDNDAVKYHRR